MTTTTLVVCGLLLAQTSSRTRMTYMCMDDARTHGGRVHRKAFPIHIMAYFARTGADARTHARTYAPWFCFAVPLSRAAFSASFASILASIDWSSRRPSTPWRRSADSLRVGLCTVCMRVGDVCRVAPCRVASHRILHRIVSSRSCRHIHTRISHWKAWVQQATGKQSTESQREAASRARKSATFNEPAG